MSYGPQNKRMNSNPAKMKIHQQIRRMHAGHDSNSMYSMNQENKEEKRETRKYKRKYKRNMNQMIGFWHFVSSGGLLKRNTIFKKKQNESNILTVPR